MSRDTRLEHLIHIIAPPSTLVNECRMQTWENATCGVTWLLKRVLSPLSVTKLIFSDCSSLQASATVDTISSGIGKPSFKPAVGALQQWSVTVNTCTIVDGICHCCSNAEKTSECECIPSLYTYS